MARRIPLAQHKDIMRQFDIKARWLFWICLSELLSMLVISNYAALLPILQKEWSLSNAEAGWIFSSYQIGYVFAVVFLASLTDYINAKIIFIASLFWTGIAGLFFAFYADGFLSALVLRALMGIGFAGIYMPGLRMVAEKYADDRNSGTAIGTYVGTFTLGVALSLFLTGFLNSLFSWRTAFMVTAIGPLAGGILAVFTLGHVPKLDHSRHEKVSLADIMSNRAAMLMIGGYVAHMWEMFGMRAWIVAFLTAALLMSGSVMTDAVVAGTFLAGILTLVGAASNVLGGYVSDRIGRAQSVFVILLLSSVISLFIGWTISLPFSLIAAVCIIYGFLVAAESSILSTGVAEFSLQGSLGRTMALQSFLGWSAASISPIVFGHVLDMTNPLHTSHQLGYYPVWGWAFALLGIGGLFGPLLMWFLAKSIRKA